MYMFWRSLFALFLLAIVLSVLLITDSDYPFGIFKHFYLHYVRGGSRGRRTRRPPPLKLKKNMIFWRKIVIFSHEIPQKSWIRPCMCHVGKNVTQMCLWLKFRSLLEEDNVQCANVGPSTITPSKLLHIRSWSTMSSMCIERIILHNIENKFVLFTEFNFGYDSQTYIKKSRLG